MANLKEVRNRIVSVNSTQQITKAMKMVSAAKLRRAQNAIQALRPYANKLGAILANLSSSMEEGEGGNFAKVRPVEKVLIVAVSSNRGLAGAFNTNIMRAINSLLANEYNAQMKAGNVSILCIGKKASDFYSKVLLTGCLHLSMAEAVSTILILKPLYPPCQDFQLASPCYRYYK